MNTFNTIIIVVSLIIIFMPVLKALYNRFIRNHNIATPKGSLPFGNISIPNISRKVKMDHVNGSKNKSERSSDINTNSNKPSSEIKSSKQMGADSGNVQKC